MGFGKSLKKAVKKVTNNVASSAKTLVTNPLSKEGLVAAASLGLATATSGASLAAPALMDSKKNGSSGGSTSGASAQNDLTTPNDSVKEKYGWGSMAELIEARKKKEAELAGRESSRVSGISSLIGRGSTLG